MRAAAPQLRACAAPPARAAAARTRCSCAVNFAAAPRAAAAAAAAALLLSVSAPLPASALAPPTSDPARCAVSRLKDFAGVRASFSAEVGSGALPEAVLDLRECSFAKLDLNAAVLSGAVLDDADFSGAQLVHADAARASARRANFRGATLTDANFFAVSFNGADLRGAVMSNAILSNATFGRDGGKDGVWAQLGGVDWEGALLSRSDATRLCENPTVDDEGRAVLGCR
jgi:hypothetical protein